MKKETKFNKFLFLIITIIISGSIVFTSSCKKEEQINCEEIQSLLDNGTSIKDILESCSVENLYGKTYQGGKIFYVNETNGTGMVVSSEDLPGIKWYNNDEYSITGVTDTLIGTGKANTAEIIASQGDGDYAAQVCSDLELNGYSDWYLPSKNEFEAIHDNLFVKGLESFQMDNFYWTSSEVEDYFDDKSLMAYGMYFTFGACYTDFKHNTDYIRPVRSF